MSGSGAGAPADHFPGFDSRRVRVGDVEIFARIGGSGPPLALLHGYPQTHVCWHRIAPALARRFTVVVPDLRGYGQSSAPAGDDEHRTYSKRAMAGDIAGLMRALGHERFAIAGHDRGGRVAYRLALDRPEVVTRLAVLDILPTAEVWKLMRAEAAIKSYHWPFLAQPAPMPERLIAAAPGFYVEHTLASWTKSRDLSAFDARALDHYRALFDDPARIHAVCEDYRAGATIDRALDEADRLDGRAITCPTLALWGSDYVGKGAAAPLDIWRAWARRLTGAEIQCGHFLAEENPDATLAALLPFLEGVDDA